MSFHLILMILHVFGAGLIIGIVLLAVIAVFKPPVTAQAMDRLRFVSHFGKAASLWMLVTGLILAYQDWGEFKGSRVFWIKIVLYVVEGILASTLLGRQARQTATQTTNGQTTSGSPLRWTLVLHAILILAIAALGVILVSGGRE